MAKAIDISNKLLDQFRNLLPTTNLRDDRSGYCYAMSSMTKGQCELVFYNALTEEYFVKVARAGNFGYTIKRPNLEPIDRIYELPIVIDDSLPYGKIVVRKA